MHGGRLREGVYQIYVGVHVWRLYAHICLSQESKHAPPKQWMWSFPKHCLWNEWPHVTTIVLVYCRRSGPAKKKERIGTGEEEKGTAQCSRDTGNVFTAITANQSASEAKDNARTSEQETDIEQRGRDTLSPLDKIVKCWDALREPKLCWLHQMLPDVPAEYLDRLDALHDGDIPDDVFLKLRAEPWKLPELPSPSDSPEWGLLSEVLRHDY